MLLEIHTHKSYINNNISTLSHANSAFHPSGVGK